MKRFLPILIFVALLFGVSQSSYAFGGLVSPRQIITTNTSATVPVVLAPAGTYASKITIIAGRSARVANTGTVYIGPTSANDTQSVAVTAGQTVTITAPAGEWIDLNEWYLDVATVNDGVIIILTQ